MASRKPNKQKKPPNHAASAPAHVSTTAPTIPCQPAFSRMLLPTPPHPFTTPPNRLATPPYPIATPPYPMATPPYQLATPPYPMANPLPATLTNPVVTKPNQLAYTEQPVMLPCHPKFRPAMRLPDINTELQPRFPESKAISKTDVINSIDEYLNLMIQDLSSQGKYLPCHQVQEILKGKLRSVNTNKRGPRISEQEIPTWEKFYKRHGRVEELIKLFCLLSPITSIHELQHAIASSEGVQNFEELCLGPILKHPAVQQCFRPPQDLQAAPEISLYNIMSSLQQCLHQHRRRNKESRVELDDFLEFMQHNLSLPSKEHLCIRIKSFPLAIQTNSRFMRAERAATERMQDELQTQLKLQLQHRSEQLKQQVEREFPLLPAATKTFPELVESMYNICSNHMKKKSAHLHVVNFLHAVLQDPSLQHTFLCVICAAAYNKDLVTTLPDSTTNFPSAPTHQLIHQPEYNVLREVVESLNALQFPIDIASLSRVEEKIADDFSVPDFVSLGNGSFLRFLAQHDAAIKALGGSTIGSQYNTNSSKRQHILELMSQVKDKSNISAISSCILEHFGATTETLGCGTVEKLIADGNKALSLQESNIIYLAPFLFQDLTEDTDIQMGRCTVGSLGHQSCEDALHCLSVAPLLEDLKEWSHWDLIYAPMHGDLSDFIHKQATKHKIYAIETSPGKLFRVDIDCSRQDFNLAVESEDSVNTAGYLVSYIVKCGGISAAPITLLADQIRTVLERMAVDEHKGEVAASLFILQCLIRIPFKLCSRIALKMFLDTFKAVYGQKAVDGLLSHCRSYKERIFLQSLGLLIGMKSWTDDFKIMLDESSQVMLNHTKQAAEVKDVACIRAEKAMPSVSLVTPASELENTSEKVLPSKVAEESQTQNEQEPSMVIIQDTYSEEREAQCQAVIESIRQDEFGIGIELDPKGKVIADKQRSREGRSLERLSKELYSTDTHFVLELIQNADDNEYRSDLLHPASNNVPSLKFVVSSTSITVLNNEVGFSEQNIRAICNVGKSTKAANRLGYIGQKGIGFKSVFRVSDTPHVHSNGYHFMFDTRSGPVGYILPQWFPEKDTNSEETERWATRIVLPLKDVNNSGVMLRKFQDIQPSLLLFLNRLRKITVENRITGEVLTMKRVDKDKGVIIIEHNQRKDQWLVERRILQNTTKYKPEVLSTEIALAFFLPTELESSIILAKDLMPQQVFAFLPLRTYGFRFIVQGDFDLPSSREDVNSDSPWNQWLREQIPFLFTDALLNCKQKGILGMSPVEATAFFLQFIPLEGELHDFFRPVSTSILNSVRGTPCLPSDPVLDSTSDILTLITSFKEQLLDSGEKSIQWLQPSQLLLVRDEFIKDHISQELLSATVHLHYVNSELMGALNESLQLQLRINNISVDHLISVAQEVLAAYLSRVKPSVGNDCSEDESDVDEVIVNWIANWFACVDFVMHSNHDLSTTTLSKLKKLTIIPLSNGSVVSAESDCIFFPPDQDDTGFKDFQGIYKELKVLNASVFKNSDDAPRTKAVLKKIGVNELGISDVIRRHILPQFCSTNWKTKPKRKAVIQYLSYIKRNIKQLGTAEANDIMNQLKANAVVVTISHGLLQPSRDPVHFSSSFRTEYDLESLFPGIKWPLLDPLYIKGEKQDGIDSWIKFFEKIGIHVGVAVQQVETRIAEDCDRWNELKELRRSPDGVYTIRDFRSQEVELLIQAVTKSPAGYHEMENLVRMLDKMWAEYAKCIHAHIFDGANKNDLGVTLPSSFHQALINLQWLPAKPSSNPLYCFDKRYYASNELYEDIPRIRQLLDSHVPYIAIQLKSDLAKLLKLKSDIQVDEMVSLMKEWKNMSKGIHSFHASIQHMAGVYIYLRNHSQEFQAAPSMLDVIIEDECIFVPHKVKDYSPTDLVEGKFYSVHKVCWLDVTTVLKDLLHNNHDLPSDIPRPLSLYYLKSEVKFADDLRSAFSHLRVAYDLNLAQLISLLSYISSLSPVPHKKDLQHFVSIIEIILRECKNDIIKNGFFQDNIADKKVFPVQNGWVSLKDCPLESDDESVYKLFKGISGAHFLQWPTEPINAENIKVIRHDITTLLKIPLSSHCIKTSVVPEYTELNSDLQSKLSNYVQIVQCYLATKLPAHYEMMRGFAMQLHSLRCYSAAKLDVIHTLNVGGQTLYAPSTPSKCELDESECILYVLKTISKDKSVLIEPLCKLFLKNGTPDERREFKSFLRDLLLKDPSTDEDKEDLMNNYSLHAVEKDEAWSTSYKAPHTQPPVVIDVDRDKVIEWTDEPHTDTEGGVKEADMESPMRCWPPNAGVSHDTKSQSKGRYNKVPSANCNASAEDVISTEDIQRARNKYSKDEISNDVTAVCGEGMETSECHSQAELIQSLGQNCQLHTASNSASHFLNQAMGHPNSPTEQFSDYAKIHNTKYRGEDGTRSNGQDTAVLSMPLQQSHKHMHDLDMTKDVAISLKPLHIDGVKESIMTSMTIVSDLATDKLVGEWGEKFVFLYLNQRKQLPDGRTIKHLTWVNESSESFKPYDLLVEEDNGNLVYIEVKSTSGGQNFAAISWNELKFAREHNINYHVYRVYGAGSAMCSISYVEGLSLHLDGNPTTLYILL